MYDLNSAKVTTVVRRKKKNTPQWIEKMPRKGAVLALTLHVRIREDSGGLPETHRRWIREAGESKAGKSWGGGGKSNK